MKTLKETIEKAKGIRYKTVICQKQDDTAEYILLPINELSINDESSDCYQTAYENNCIAIAVCSGERDLLWGAGIEKGTINYCDL